MKNSAGLVLAAAAAALVSGAAVAVPLVYSDETAFLAATGSAAALLPAPSGIKNAPPNPINLEGSPVSLTNMRYGIVDPLASTRWGNFTAYGRRVFGISGVENFNIVSSAPLYALGFSIWEPTSSASNGCNATCYQSTFTFELFSGLTSRGSFTLSPADNQWVFWGVADADPFDRIQVRDTRNTIDNEFFSQFWYQAVPNGAPIVPSAGDPPSGDDNDFSVPEPASLLLITAGLGVLAARRRKLGVTS